MGEPILGGSDVPTTLPTNESGHVVRAPMVVAGDSWTATAVSMGNPHAVVFSRNGSDVVVCLLSVAPVCSFPSAVSVPAGLVIA